MSLRTATTRRGSQVSHPTIPVRPNSADYKFAADLYLRVGNIAEVERCEARARELRRTKVAREVFHETALASRKYLTGDAAEAMYREISRGVLA